MAAGVVGMGTEGENTGSAGSKVNAVVAGTELRCVQARVCVREGQVGRGVCVVVWCGVAAAMQAVCSVCGQVACRRKMQCVQCVVGVCGVCPVCVNGGGGGACLCRGRVWACGCGGGEVWGRKVGAGQCVGEGVWGGGVCVARQRCVGQNA